MSTAQLDLRFAQDAVFLRPSSVSFSPNLNPERLEGAFGHLTSSIGEKLIKGVAPPRAL